MKDDNFSSVKLTAKYKRKKPKADGQTDRRAGGLVQERYLQLVQNVNNVNLFRQDYI